MTSLGLTWIPLDTWIVVTAALAAMACALPGVFLVLRRMSMMGDAISHAVLPGLAGAFLFTGMRTSGVMFLGAAAVAIAATLLIHGVHRWGNVESGAAMGVVFSALFALGLVMLHHATHTQRVDLDADCVLYGSLEMTVLDTWNVLGIEAPRAAFVLGGALLLNALFVVVLFKELRLSSFDPGLAKALGFRPGVMHVGLMVVVAITTVAAFEAIGSILVIAMLIVPAATALLLVHRLAWVIVVSLLFAIASAGLGHLAAIGVPPMFGFVDTTTAGSMATVAGVLFAIVLVGTAVWRSYARRARRVATPSNPA
ncbi:MAG: metal ABC transporter permease [Phycisphaeraceae bacterium]